MRTLIVNNYLPNSPQIEQLYDVIKDVIIHIVEVKDYSTLSRREDFEPFDVIVLSGSQHKLAEPGIFESYAPIADFLKETVKPVLGICFGHQFLAMTFGENVVSTGKMLEGYYMVRQLEEDELFGGITKEFLVMESHEERIENVPYNYIRLADSPNCPVEIMKHEILPLYSVQFHPERYDAKHPAGFIILENFFRIASWYTK